MTVDGKIVCLCYKFCLAFSQNNNEDKSEAPVSIISSSHVFMETVAMATEQIHPETPVNIKPASNAGELCISHLYFLLFLLSMRWHTGLFSLIHKYQYVDNLFFEISDAFCAVYGFWNYRRSPARFLVQVL